MSKTHFPAVGGYAWASFLSFYFANAPVGNVFWVDSNSTTGGDAVGFGFSPEAPFLSIQFALTQCANDNGDFVMVMPNHVEVVGASATTMSASGVYVLGMGVGRQRGTITYTNAAGYWNMDKARCVIDNLTFVGTGVATLTQIVGIAAADCTIQNCEFEHANATNQAADVIITTAAANRFYINNCDFHGSANAGTNHCISIVGGTDCEVNNCNFQGAYHASQGIIRVLTTATVNLVVEYCTMQNSTAANTKAIVDGITGSSGQIRNNTFQILSGTAPITGATFSWVGSNYYANAVATAGTLI
jgi:pectate lyase